MDTAQQTKDAQKNLAEWQAKEAALAADLAGVNRKMQGITEGNARAALHSKSGEYAEYAQLAGERAAKEAALNDIRSKHLPACRAALAAATKEEVGQEIRALSESIDEAWGLAMGEIYSAAVRLGEIQAQRQRALELQKINTQTISPFAIVQTQLFQQSLKDVLVQREHRLRQFAGSDPELQAEQKRLYEFIYGEMLSRSAALAKLDAEHEAERAHLKRQRREAAAAVV